MTENETKLKEVEHHKQHNICSTRPPYRQGKKPTAVKVYTVTSESQHLFIYGVPKINLRNELKALCMRYGQVKALHAVADYKTEIFTECYHVQYERIQSARVAKRVVDTRSFYGGILHVCYAPEFETVKETRNKLMQRKRDVLRRLQSESEIDYSNHTESQALTSFVEPEASCSSQYPNSSRSEINLYNYSNVGRNYTESQDPPLTSFIEPEASCNSQYQRSSENHINLYNYSNVGENYSNIGENYSNVEENYTASQDPPLTDFIEPEADYSSQYQISSRHVKNNSAKNNANGKFGRKRKVFGEFEDPLLAIHTKYGRHEKTKQVGGGDKTNNGVESNEKKLGEYGPFLENYTPQIKRTNLKEMPKLIPSQVISNKQCDHSNKRIVFRKK